MPLNSLGMEALCGLFLIIAAMNRVQLGGLMLWQFPNWQTMPGLVHFVSDRQSGGAGNEFTLSLSSTPDKEQVRSNRARVAKALGLAAHRLYFPSQVHETKVVRVSSNTTSEDLLNTDALITNEPGIGIAVMSADCVPILLYDPRHRAVGAVHSGWRGTVAHILTKTLMAMQSAFGTQGKDLRAAIGPSVSEVNYEVGIEVVRAVEAAFSESNSLLVRQPNGKARLNLWKANILQLEQFGVLQEHITLANLCSISNNQYFFSARKGDSGRYAAGLALV